MGSTFMLKNLWWVGWSGVVWVVSGPHDFSHSPLRTNLGFKLGWTWLENKGFGPGLDNSKGWFKYCLYRMIINK